MLTTKRQDCSNVLILSRSGWCHNLTILGTIKNPKRFLEAFGFSSLEEALKLRLEHLERLGIKVQNTWMVGDRIFLDRISVITCSPILVLDILEEWIEAEAEIDEN